MKTCKIFITLFLLAVLPACNQSDEKGELELFTAVEKDFTSYVNQFAAPVDPDLSQDKSIINLDYPIEIALYNDGRWYYDLPNLDEGFGTWKYDNGSLKLHAVRTLFDMHIRIVPTTDGAKAIGIKFSDRFGPKFLPMDKKNIL